MCIYMGRSLRVTLLPTPETGNSSNMDLSVASFKALGSDLSSVSRPERQDQWVKMSKVKGTDVLF